MIAVKDLAILYQLQLKHWKGDKVKAIAQIVGTMIREITNSDRDLLSGLREQEYRWLALYKRLNDSSLNKDAFRCLLKVMEPALWKTLRW